MAQSLACVKRKTLRILGAMSTDLVADTVERLRKCEQPLAEIAEGAGVSLRWLGYLKSGETEFPNLRHLTALREYLDSAKSRSKPRKVARAQRASA
jgi:hypothetical protein